MAPRGRGLGIAGKKKKTTHLPWVWDLERGDRGQTWDKENFGCFDCKIN